MSDAALRPATFTKNGERLVDDDIARASLTTSSRRLASDDSCPTSTSPPGRLAARRRDAFGHGLCGCIPQAQQRQRWQNAQRNKNRPTTGGCRIGDQCYDAHTQRPRHGNRCLHVFQRHVVTVPIHPASRCSESNSGASVLACAVPCDVRGGTAAPSDRRDCRRPKTTQSRTMRCD
jgi:hypothetical protein